MKYRKMELNISMLLILLHKLFINLLLKHGLQIKTTAIRMSTADTAEARTSRALIIDSLVKEKLKSRTMDLTLGSSVS